MSVLEEKAATWINYHAHIDDEVEFQSIASTYAAEIGRHVRAIEAENKALKEQAKIEALKEQALKIAIDNLKATIAKLEAPWISVEEPPEKGGLYWCMMAGDPVAEPEPLIVAYYQGRWKRETVTHYAAIPPLPTGEKG